MLTLRCPKDQDLERCVKSSRFSVAMALLTTFLCSGVTQADTLRVAVASNFKPIVQQLADRFRSATGHQVLLSAASTGVLFNQLTHGAPFDLFLSADSERPQQLFELGKLVEAPKTYAYGRLVFWQPGNHSIDYKTLTSWQGRLAMANPKTAPYGLAAQQVLESFKLWGEEKIQLLQGANIQQAWQYVATGNAAAGFVALSQMLSDPVLSNKTPADYLLLRDELYNPIRQDLAILNSGNTALTKQFVAFILEPAQQELIQAAGYYPVSTVTYPESSEPTAPPVRDTPAKAVM